MNYNTKVIYRTTEINTGRIEEMEVTLFSVIGEKRRALIWAKDNLNSKDFEIVPKKMLDKEDARRYYVELKLTN